MAVNFSTLVYLPNFDFWARAITVTPLASQPGAPSYIARGIYDTRGTVVETELGMAVLSDQETICDVRESEFSVVPKQGDLIDIPAYEGIDAVGTFEVTDAWTNGGGETTLVIRKLVTPTPIPSPLLGFEEK